MSVLQRRETVKLADLHHPEKNVRMHPERQLQELERSLDMFGQTRDLVIDETGLVLAGNGLMMAMKRKGIEEAGAIRLIGLTEAQKLKFMLADNKTFTLGVEDLDGINEALARLGEDLDVPGYDPDTLAALVATGEEITGKLNQYGTIDEQEIASIRANGERKEEMERRAEVSGDVGGDNNGTPGESPANAGSAEDEKPIICPECGATIWR